MLLAFKVAKHMPQFAYNVPRYQYLVPRFT